MNCVNILRAYRPSLEDVLGGPLGPEDFDLTWLKDEHAGRADRDVVYVGKAAWDLAVAQEPHAAVGQFVETLAEQLLALRSALPCRRALRIVREGEDQAAELRVALADPLLTLR